MICYTEYIYINKTQSKCPTIHKELINGDIEIVFVKSSCARLGACHMACAFTWWFEICRLFVLTSDMSATLSPPVL